MLFLFGILKMENDWVYRVGQLVNYPWVSRMDRTIYEEYPQIDPVGLARRCFFAGIGGYSLGRYMGWNRSLSTLVSVLPFITKFLAD